MTVYEVTVRCSGCTDDEGRPTELGVGLYEADADDQTDHETAGLAFGLVAAHQAVHPDHAVAYARETTEAAATRRAVAAAGLRADLEAALAEREEIERTRPWYRRGPAVLGNDPLDWALRGS